MPSFESAYAWFQPIYTWSKDWQDLLGGLLAVFAACIFAIGSVKAARIRAGTTRSSIRRADLRSMAVPTHDEPKPAGALPLASVSLTSVSPATVISPQDLSPNLDHLRWLIRTGLSPKLSSEVSQTSLIGCCERIRKLRLESTALPDRASETAQAQRKALLQDVNALRQLADTQASTSELISALIKLNASARGLAASLSDETTGTTGAANLSG